MKESRKTKDKLNTKDYGFERFCTSKGLTRKKSPWEIDCEKEIEKKEGLFKEMTERKKLAKSKKKKLELHEDPDTTDNDMEDNFHR